RYRVGTNYLQLPINSPRKHVATNQRDGQMTYYVDVAPGTNPHVNYEPSSLNGLKEAPKAGKDHTPLYNARLVREKISRQNDFKQAGETYRNFEDWERDELIYNLVSGISAAEQHIQDKMVELFTQCDADYGRRVKEGLEMAAKEKKDKMNGMSKQEKEHQAVQQAEAMAKNAKPY
ncbi:MAG: catalase, partial [Sphingobacteriales bacterium]